MNQIKIGLMGFGNIGSGTYEVMYTNKEKIEKSAKCKFTFEKILVKSLDEKFRIPPPPELLTENPSDILENNNIDLVIELIGGIDFAYELVKKALLAKKHVVTANKALIATHGQELIRLATENGVLLRYEASVGGGIPILTSLTEALCANEFTEVTGIVNGTTNYILTQMSENGLEYSDALKEAQTKGFAEADPTADVEGVDAAHKLSILISLMFEVYVQPKDIPTRGITKITKEEILSAKNAGKKIKLLVTAKKNADNSLTYKVGPELITNSHPLAFVNNEFNALLVKGNAVDELMFYGRGAGALPTGSAIVGDIISIAKNI